jgi:hypothetical protein
MRSMNNAPHSSGMLYDVQAYRFFLAQYIKTREPRMTRVKTDNTDEKKKAGKGKRGEERKGGQETRKGKSI